VLRQKAGRESLELLGTAEALDVIEAELRK
jgi:hypothetical protein